MKVTEKRLKEYVLRHHKSEFIVSRCPECNVPNERYIIQDGEVYHCVACNCSDTKICERADWQKLTDWLNEGD